MFECLAVSLLGFTPGCLSVQQLGCSTVWQFHSWVSLLGVRVFGSLGVECSAVLLGSFAPATVGELCLSFSHFTFISLSYTSLTTVKQVCCHLVGVFGGFAVERLTVLLRRSGY